MNSFRDAIRRTFGPRCDTGHAGYDFLPPQATERPRPRSAPARRDVVDAHFITLPATGRGFSNDNRKPSPRPAVASRAIGRLEARLRRLSNDAYSAVVAAVFVGVFMICGGFSIIPGETQVAIERPLELVHVSVTPQDSGGMRVLLVNGIVENRSGNARNLPAIRADIFADGRLIASTLIAPPVNEIGADHSRGFSAKLRHPGGKNPDVRLSFDDAGVSRS